MSAVLLTIRIYVSFAFVLYLPGLILSYWMFPRHMLRQIERAFVALILSIILSSVASSALVMWTRDGLTAPRFQLLLTVVMVVCAGGVMLRNRTNRRPQEAPREDFATSTVKQGFLQLPSPIGFYGTATLVVVAVLQSVSPSTTTIPASLTEFYIPIEHIEEVVQPRNWQETANIPVAIANHEQRQVTYRIEAWQGERRISERIDIIVAPDTAWHGTIAVPTSARATTNALEIRLFRDEEVAPLAYLRLSSYLASVPIN